MMMMMMMMMMMIIIIIIIIIITYLIKLLFINVFSQQPRGRLQIHHNIKTQIMRDKYNTNTKNTKATK